MLLRGLLCRSLQKDIISPKCITGLFSRSIYYQLKDEIPDLTIGKIIKDLYATVDIPIQWNRSAIQRSQERRYKMADMGVFPKDQSELPLRTMRDSLSSCVIPLGRNPSLREKYVTSFEAVRIGRLIEDIDAFAVYVCYKHILNPMAMERPNPYTIVTASVDSLNFPQDKILIDEDLRISGHVSTTGKSSMEVSILVDQKNKKGEWIKMTNAVFVMAAREPTNSRSAIINKLVSETPEEVEFMLRGKERSQRRMAGSPADSKPPIEEEIQILHKMLVDLPGKEVRKMDKSSYESIVLCHPENRNIYNKIFGGFIMKQAVEVACTLGLIYGRSVTRILTIDEVIFKKPVEIGDLLSYTARVGYVDGKHLHIPVIAERISISSGKREVTNVFRFNFKFAKELPPLVPITCQEALTYLEARRHFLEMVKRPNDY